MQNQTTGYMYTNPIKPLGLAYTANLDGFWQTTPHNDAMEAAHDPKCLPAPFNYYMLDYIGAKHAA
jgi:hypothetical protein